MVWLPLIPSERMELPSGCRQLGGPCSNVSLQRQLAFWQRPDLKADLLLVLGGTRTAEWPGISAAGSTPVARRVTALADAELLLRGTARTRRWPLPVLPAGVSPALLSRVVVEALGLDPVVAALGLPHQPDFLHLRLERASGPRAVCPRVARCRTTAFNASGSKGAHGRASASAAVRRNACRVAPRRPRLC